MQVVQRIKIPVLLLGERCVLDIQDKAEGSLMNYSLRRGSRPPFSYPQLNYSHSHTFHLTTLIITSQQRKTGESFNI